MNKYIPRRRSRPETSLRATVFQVTRAADNTSRQIEAIDEFAGFVASTNGGVLLPTPYNVGVLYSVIERSSSIRPCIDAYVTNTVLTGWEVDAAFRGKTIDEGERHELQSFIDRSNTDQSLSAVMALGIRDRESVGFGFVEVIRDASRRLALLRHASSRYTRLSQRHEQEVLVRQEIMRGRRVSYVEEYRRFRRFVQIIGGRQVWFREFGDPRIMDSRTGIFAHEPGYKPGADATEIIHLKLPSNEPYGVPRWINQLPSILGSREAEEVNMRYFQDNTVPPMMLLVGGGRLTRASYDELSRTLNQEGIGGDRQNKILLLEAVGDSDTMDGKSSTIDLKVEKLSDTRQSDGLFKDYDAANQQKVRSCWRLPPVLVGMSQDVNFATASTSVFVAESQVFAPDRSENDEILNMLLVNGAFGLQLRTCKLTSRTPAITSPELVVKTLTAMNVMGAVTPRSAQQVVNKMLQLELPEYPKPGEEGYEEWMDKPITITAGEQKQHDLQNQKSDKVKDTEDTGNVGPDVPKHGEE